MKSKSLLSFAITNNMKNMFFKNIQKKCACITDFISCVFCTLFCIRFGKEDESFMAVSAINQTFMIVSAINQTFMKTYSYCSYVFFQLQP